MAPPRQLLTHFLCIPLVTSTSRPHLSRSLSVLRADVSTPGASGPALLPPEAVRPPGSLHFTLGVMSFPQNEGLDRAIDLLRNLKPREILRDTIVASTSPATMRLRTTTTTTTATTTTTKTAIPPADTARSKTTTTTTAAATTTDGATGVGSAIDVGFPVSSFAITLRGLRAMGNPSKTGVLYSPPVDELGILQRFSEAVRGAFSAANLVVDEGRPLLLHATLINTGYVKAGSRRGGGRRGPKLEVDATALIDQYGGQVWLENLCLDRLAICKMGARSISDAEGKETDAAYEVEADVRF